VTYPPASRTSLKLVKSVNQQENGSVGSRLPAGCSHGQRPGVHQPGVHGLVPSPRYPPYALRHQVASSHLRLAASETRPYTHGCVGWPQERSSGKRRTERFFGAKTAGFRQGVDVGAPEGIAPNPASSGVAGGRKKARNGFGLWGDALHVGPEYFGSVSYVEAGRAALDALVDFVDVTQEQQRARAQAAEPCRDLLGRRRVLRFQGQDDLRLIWIALGAFQSLGEDVVAPEIFIRAPVASATGGA
jgi:hypothetical protein